LRDPRPAKRGEGGERRASARCEPGEGLSRPCRLPLTRLAPSALGTLSPLHGARVTEPAARSELDRSATGQTRARQCTIPMLTFVPYQALEPFPCPTARTIRPFSISPTTTAGRWG